MGLNSESTSTSLIHNARANDVEAWQKLGEIYAPLVLSWAQRAGLQESDAADVVQEVFGIVLKSLDRFRRDRPGDTFRGWLWTITRNEIRRSYRRSKRERARGGTEALQQLSEIPDWVSETSTIGEIRPDVSEEKQLIQRAASAIKDDFEEHTWQAFWRLAVDGHSSAEIAQDLNLTTGAVRQAKFRVLARLREFLA